MQKTRFVFEAYARSLFRSQVIKRRVIGSCSSRLHTHWQLLTLRTHWTESCHMRFLRTMKKSISIGTLGSPQGCDAALCDRCQVKTRIFQLRSVQIYIPLRFWCSFVADTNQFLCFFCLNRLVLHSCGRNVGQIPNI
jgi:hypothetical protein